MLSIPFHSQKVLAVQMIDLSTGEILYDFKSKPKDYIPPCSQYPVFANVIDSALRGLVKTDIQVTFRFRCMKYEQPINFDYKPLIVKK